MEFPRRWLTALLLLWAALPVLRGQGTTNDLFASARRLAGDRGLVTNRFGNAAPETGEPRPFPTAARGTMWFRWNAQTDGFADFRLTNNAFNWRMAAYSGTNLAGLVFLDASDSRPVARFMLQVTNGGVYHVVVDPGTQGFQPFHLAWDSSPVAIALPGTQPVAGKPTPVGIVATGFTPSGVTYTDLAQPVATAAEAPFTAFWTPLQHGPQSLQAVVTNAQGRTVPSLVRDVIVAPANDEAADAAELPGDGEFHRVLAPVRYATGRPSEPFSTGNLVYRSLWWKWTPVAPGPVTIVSGNSALPVNGDSHVLVGSPSGGFSNALPSVPLLSTRERSLEPVPGTTYWFVLTERYGDEHLALRDARLEIRQENSGLQPPPDAVEGRPLPLVVTNVNPARPLAQATFRLDGAAVGDGVADAGGMRLVWTPEAPGAFALSVDGTNGFGERFEFGPFPLRVRPANDDLADAAAIPPDATRFRLRGPIHLGTAEDTPYESASDPSLWWRWTPSRRSLAWIREETGFDVRPYAAALAGTDGGGLVYTGSYTSQGLVFEAVPGTTYWFRLAGGPSDFSPDSYPELVVRDLIPRVPSEATEGDPMTLGVEDAAGGRTVVRVEWISDRGPGPAPAVAPPFSTAWLPDALGMHELVARVTFSDGTTEDTLPRLAAVRPRNDTRAQASRMVLTRSGWAGMAITAGASAGADEPVAGVWYRWEATEPGEVLFGPGAGSQGATLTLWRERGGAAPEQLAVENNQWGRHHLVAVSPGDVLFLHVGDPHGAGAGATFLFLGPANDAFADAAPVPADGRTVVGTFRGAGLEPLEPRPLCGGSASRWWRLRFPVASTVEVRFTNTWPSAVAAVHRGGALASLATVLPHRQIRYDTPISSYPPHVFEAEAGVDYWLQVLNQPQVCGAGGGDIGEFQFRVVHKPSGSTTPVRIVEQSAGHSPAAGGFAAAWVLADGGLPITHQWRKDGVVLPGATEPWITWDAFPADAAGVYDCVVSNAAGTAVSMPVRLEPRPAGATGAWRITGSGPVMRPNGMPAGGLWRAQAWAGAAYDTLAPVSAPTPFVSGEPAGFWTPILARPLGHAPGSVLQVQLRVWDGAYGATYEQARLNGGGYWVSEPLARTVPEPGTEVADGEWPGFGIPSNAREFHTGVLEPVAFDILGRPDFLAVSHPLHRRRIERSRDGVTWEPLADIWAFHSHWHFRPPHADFRHRGMELFRIRTLD